MPRWHRVTSECAATADVQLRFLAKQLSRSFSALLLHAFDNEVTQDADICRSIIQCKPRKKRSPPYRLQRSSFQPNEQKRWLVKYLNCRVACSPFTLSSMSRAKILDPKILQSPAFPNPSLAASQVSWDFPDFPEFQWFLTEATAINRRVHQDLAVNLLSTMPGALRYHASDWPGHPAVSWTAFTCTKT